MTTNNKNKKTIAQVLREQGREYLLIDTYQKSLMTKEKRDEINRKIREDQEKMKNKNFISSI